jgi:hypothetical protein
MVLKELFIKKLINKQSLKKIKIFLNIYHKYLQAILVFALITVFIALVDVRKIFEILSSVKINYLIFSFTLFLLAMFLNSIKFYILINSFINFKFIDILKINAKGQAANLLLMNGFAVDVYKYFKLKKKINSFTSFMLVFIDRFISLFFKIIFFTIIFNVYNIFLLNFYIQEVLAISIIFIALSVFVFANFEKIITPIFKIKKLLKKKNIILNIYHSIKKKIFWFLTINFFIHTNITLIYVCIFKSLMLEDFIFDIILLNTIIETLSQLSLMLPGSREVITISIFNFMNINFQESIVSAFCFLFLNYISIIVYNFIIIFLKKN